MKSLLLFILFIIVSKFAIAQCNSNSINEADKEYLIGNFENVIKQLTPCVNNGFNDMQKVQAYRILSKTYIALDEDSSAVSAAAKLLAIKPDFQADNLTDPFRFVEIIERLKSFGNMLFVTSVSKKAENILEAPATVVSISKAEFYNRGYQDFETVLHDLPGFDISRSNGNLYTHAYQRGYRSINTNRTLFLIDGIEDNDLWSSNVYLSRQFPLSNLKSLEVVYGPASTMYGSNAFLGVINIITKQPYELIKQGEIFGSNIIAGYGSYNTKFADATFALQSKNQQLALSVTARIFVSDEQDFTKYDGYTYQMRQYNDSIAKVYHNSLDITDSAKALAFIDKYGATHDYYSFENNKIILTETGIKKALELDNSVYSNTIARDYTDDKSIYVKLKIYELTLGWMAWQIHEAAGAQYNDIEFMTAEQGHSWAPVHNTIYANYEKNITDKLQISNYIQFKLHDFDKENKIVRFREYRYSSKRKYKLENLLNNDLPKIDSTFFFQKSNQFRNELKILYTPNNKIDILAGFETRYSVLQGDYTYTASGNTEEVGTSLSDVHGGNHFFVRDLGVYMQTTYRIFKTLKFTYGIRYDNNLIRNTAGFGNVFNPRYAMVFSPKKYIFKIIYSEAFKDATNREKFSTVIGKREIINPELEPEKVRNWEFSIAKTFFDNQLYINLVGYHANYSNIIQEVSVKLTVDGKEVTTNQNQGVGKQEVYGLHGFVNFNYNNLNIFANYTYTMPWVIDPVDSYNNPYTNPEGEVITKLRISDIATNNANLGLNYKWRNTLNANFRINYVGEKIVGENTTVTTNHYKFEDYFLFNTTITYNFFKTAALQLIVNNIFNKKYYSPGLDDADGELSARLPQFGRHLQLKLMYEF